jgi:copper(I)-binding protein
MRRVAAAAVVMAFTMTACGGTSEPSATVPGIAPEVHVLEAIVAVRGDKATLGFAAHNAGTGTDTLVAASCGCAERARTVGDTSIDSQETAVFSAEGPHVRLTGVDPGLEPGGFTDVTLTFAEAGDVVVPAEVVRP